MGSNLQGIVVALILVFPWPVNAATRRAKIGGVSSGDCDNWTTNACSLDYAVSAANIGDSVWVKAGTYGPIALVSGIKLIGGFAGTETLVSQSNPSTNVTTISGGTSERSIISESSAPETILRGFSIVDGFRYDDFNENADERGGGGLFLKNSSAIFVQCTFENNKSVRFGGAVAIHGTNSTPHFVNCIFRNNGNGTAGAALDTAVQPMAGGAIYLQEGSPTFVNCLFHDNKAGEGAVLANVAGNPTFVNCTLSKNYAKIGYGGGLHDKTGKSILRNCIVWGNVAVKDGDQIKNSAFASTPITFSDVEGAWSGDGNLNVDPLFVSGVSNFRLQDESLCIDQGKHVKPALPNDVGDLDWDNNTSEPIPLDLGQNARRFNIKVDLGAFENYTKLPPPPPQD